MYTNTTRMTGLSGIDTEAMIKQIMTAKSVKYNNMRKTSLLTQYKQESYRSVASSLKTFQTSFLSLTSNLSASLRLSANFKGLSASVKISGSSTETSDISIKTATGAATGTYKLKVEQIAQKDQYVGATSDSYLPSMTGTGGLSLLAVEAGESFKISLDGATSKTITFTEDDVDYIQGAGNDAAELAKRTSELMNEKLRTAFGTDTLQGNAQKVSATFTSDGGIVIKSLSGHTAAISGGDETLAKLGFENGAKTAFDTSRTLEEVFGSDAFVGGQASFTINGKTFDVLDSETLDDVMNRINSAGLNVKLSFDTSKSSFVLESTGTGQVNTITFNDNTGSFMESALLIGGSNGSLTAGAERSSVAQDAIITLDGNRTTRETNSFTIGGLSITLNQDSVNRDELGNVTPKEFTINVNTDIADTKKLILNFVDEYNKLIESLNALVNTSRPRSDGSYYMPLTPEEEADMSESQIKNWTEQAKTGMLHRDSIVTNILSQMRQQLNASVPLADGGSISLYSIGIQTSSRTSEGGKLVIDDAKLTKALEERMEDVDKLFTKSSGILWTDKANRGERMKNEGLAERVNDIINGAIDLNGSIYEKAGIVGTSSEKNNDLYWKLKSQTDAIALEKSKLVAYENRQFVLFSKLESAMMQYDSQVSYLQSMLGA